MGKHVSWVTDIIQILLHVSRQLYSYIPVCVFVYLDLMQVLTFQRTGGGCVDVNPSPKMRLNVGPVNKISLGIFSSQNHIAPEVLRMCNDLFQNVVRLYRPFLDIFKQFLSFSGQRRHKTQKLSKECLLDNKVD